jgi:PAS domain S-box-containing protein
VQNFFDNLDLYRTVLETLPVGVFIADRKHVIRFWNHGAERLAGYLAHEAVGQDGSGPWLDPCDRHGQTLVGDHDPLTVTLTNGHPQQCLAYFRHRNGNRVAVHLQTSPILENNDAIAGAVVVFEEGFMFREETSGPPMYGCLDSATGIPSHRLTRAVLNECVADLEHSRNGFGLLRLRVLGLDEFRSKHGIQSAFPILRTAAQTLRHSLDPGIFVGRWGEDEFIIILPSANHMSTLAVADTVWSMVSRSEVTWWGDSFPIQAVVAYTVAQSGDQLAKLLNRLEPAHAAAAGCAIGAAASGP